MMRYRIFERVSFGVLLIIIWQGIYVLGVDVLDWWKPYAVPSPMGVWQTLVKLVKGQTLFLAIAASMRRVLIGYLLSILIGLILGLLMASCRYLNENMKPLILGLQTLPSICWVPFAILWYGLDESAIIFVIVIGSAFSIAMSIDDGLHNVNPLYIRAAKTMGARGKDLYVKVIFPASMPALISGLKQGWSFAWRALMSGEMMTATIGLGQVLMWGRDLADINQVMVVMIVIVCIGTLIDHCIFKTIENRVRRSMGLDKERA